jgi:hypothetical protein
LPYCFNPKKYGGVPDIEIKRINEYDSFDIEGLKITPIRVMHYKLPIMGFRIKDFCISY